MPNLSDIIANQGAPTIGNIQAFAGSSAPSGWLLCDGSAVSRTTYALLFATIGTVFGVGNGTTTFNLPNSSGVFLRSSGSQSVSAKTFNGSTVGTKVGHITGINGLTAATSCTPAATLNNTDLSHTHSITDFYGSVSTVAVDHASGEPSVKSNSSSSQADTTASALTTHTHTPTYSVAHTTTLSSSETETAPAALSLNFIIKA